MRGDELQTFGNKSSPIRENLEENFSVFFEKYVKPHPRAKTKDNLQKTVFNSSYQNLATFLDELQRITKYAFEIAAHAIIQQFIFPKMPPQPKKLINRAQLENGSYEQIVLHLERELVLSSLEASEVNRASQLATKTFKESEPTCHHCNEQRNYKNQWRQLSKQEEQDADTKNSSGKMMVHPQTVTPTPVTTSAITTTKLTENLEVFVLPAWKVWQNEPLDRKIILELMQQTNHLHGKVDRQHGARPNELTHQLRQKKCPGWSAALKLEMSRLHFGAAIDRLESTTTVVPLLPEVAWLQTSLERSKSVNTPNTQTIKTTQKNHMPEIPQKNDVESEASILEGTSPQKSVSTTESVQ